jgi:formylglycine-generating enzyme required for sulfatase activity
MGVTAGLFAIGGASVNCVLLYSFTLFLSAVATAICGVEARANDVDAMMRGADQAFIKTFADGFVRKPWPRSRLGRDDFSLAKQAEQALIGSASAAPNEPGFQIPSAEAIRQADTPAARAAPPQAGRGREAVTEKQETRTGVESPPPVRPAPKQAPARVAKAEPSPPPLPEASASSPAGFTFKDCDNCPQLVVVPKGEFMMGSNKHPYEKPEHKVQIAYPFAIGQHEVTYAEWDRCVDAGVCSYWSEFDGSPNDAIGNLSWDDANAYLKWLSQKTGQTYRLPSEAEWEYVAHAGSDRPTAAGSQKANPLGLLDTAGKMAEWVQDCWNESFRGAPADGSAWLKGNCNLRALRGGSFDKSSRFRYDGDVRYEANGFRVLRELR